MDRAEKAKLNTKYVMNIDIYSFVETQYWIQHSILFILPFYTFKSIKLSHLSQTQPFWTQTSGKIICYK